MVRGFIVTVLLLMSATAGAHGGGLDKHGCHNDRRNGGYHCHRGPTASAAPRVNTDAHSLQSDSGDVTFGSCAQARAAGAAPVRRGDPGYSRRLDRDGDGVGCE